MTGPLNYIGKSDSDAGEIATYDWAAGEATAVAVNNTFVNSTIATYTPALTTQSYINSQVALRATQAAVNTDQALYVNASQKGAANGVATLDSNGFVTSAQVPSGISTDNIARCYNATGAHGTVSLTTTHTVTTTTPTEYIAATINIPNPGYPYVPQPFVYIQGQAGGSQAGRGTGTTDFGLIAVMPTPVSGTGNIYALGGCTATPHLDWYTALPTSSLVSGGNIVMQTTPAVTPTVVPPTSGTLSLNCYLSCLSGNSFTFSGTGFMFFVITWPAI